MRAERRWGPIAMVFVVLGLLYLLPNRIRLMPVWVPYAGAAFLLIPLFGVQLARAKRRWVRLERTATVWFLAFTGFLSVLALWHLVTSIVFHTREIEPLPLLASTVAIWAINLMNFTLTYWEMDDGGPELRLLRRERPDFVFAETGLPDLVGPDWRPKFVDYLFLSFTTSTAFSPTDTLPLTARAKILMMAQGLISLVLVVVVAARAIGLLQ